jgi:hypothetical protein
VLLLILGHHAAAQTTEKIINLLCNGTSATNDIQEPANNVRLVVDLTDGTVTGFGIITRIDRADDASISFSGKGPLYVRGMTVGTISLTGEFDRVSSGLTVIATTALPSSEAAKSYNYQLTCKSRSGERFIMKKRAHSPRRGIRDHRGSLKNRTNKVF